MTIPFPGAVRQPVSHDDPSTFLSDVPTGLLIGGQWRGSADRRVFSVDDPATGRALTDVADAAPEDGVAALAAAAAAQRAFARTPPRERAEMLRRAFGLLLARLDDFAVLITLEMGKPLEEARDEVRYGAEFLRWFSEEAVRIDGRFKTAPDGRARLLEMRRPVGPCLFIAPWNFPLAMATRKLAPAIAAGCASVLKPSALTPLTSLALAAVLMDAGVPAGAVNVVPTTRSAGLTGPLLSDQRLRKLSFTGSTQVGRALLRMSADRVLRTSMELGGNAPFIVFPGADLDEAVAAAAAAKLRNAGEACTAADRFLVHESIAEEFGARLAGAFAGVRMAPGLTAGSDLGPLIDERSRRGVHELVTAAVEGGARVLTGGVLPGGDGYVYPPTVLGSVRPGAAVVQQEVFGPVAPVLRFRTEEEAVALANDTAAGLAGYVFTSDIDRVLRIAEDVEVGMLGVSKATLSDPAAPFGGVKECGLGREGIAEFLETVYAGLADPRRPEAALPAGDLAAGGLRLSQVDGDETAGRPGNARHDGAGPLLLPEDEIAVVDVAGDEREAARAARPAPARVRDVLAGVQEGVEHGLIGRDVDDLAGALPTDLERRVETAESRNTREPFVVDRAGPPVHRQGEHLVEQRSRPADVHVRVVRRGQVGPQVEHAGQVAVVRVDAARELGRGQLFEVGGRLRRPGQVEQPHMLVALPQQRPEHGPQRRDADASGDEQIARGLLQRERVDGF